MIDKAHIERIRKVLEVLQGEDTAYAVLACEDAQVALTMGVAFGLTANQVLEKHVDITTHVESVEHVH